MSTLESDSFTEASYHLEKTSVVLFHSADLDRSASQNP